MNQSSLTYHITAEFLSTLRAEGRTVGIGKHLQIQTLLKQLPDEADAEALKLALVPLIAQSPQEQERLYETFDQCVKRVEERQKAIEIDPSVSSDNIPKVGNFWNVLKAVILLVLLLAIGGGLWRKYHQNKPPVVQNPVDSTKINPNDTLTIKPNTPSATSSPFVENKPYPFPNHLEQYALKPPTSTQAWLSEHWTSLRWILALVLTALLLAIWRYRAWKRRKLVAQQDPNDKPPYIWNINIEGIEPIVMGNSLDRLTQQFRRRAQSDTLRMDMERTVHATIEQGGLPVFKYKRATNPTDYLLLIDRQSVRNHRAQLFDTLYELFKAQEIEMARYFFDSDVRVCYSEDYPNGIALADLQQRYYQSRLLIVGTGAQLLSPLSGKAAAWTTVFNQWKDRALFSPKPLKAWGYDERQLATAFTTLPATLQGLGFWVEELDAGADARFDGWQDKIDDAPTAPIIPDDNDPLPILDLYFEPDMLRWIAACAIYPTLHWDLTLWLRQTISDVGFRMSEANEPKSEIPHPTSFDNLMQLCRLSWFVKGEMPDATRTALLNWLEQTDAPLLTRLRAAIALELQKNPPPKDSAAWDKFRLNIALNEWLSTTDADKKKELEAEVSQLLEKGAEPDFTVIKYLQKPRTALDFIVPDAWKKYVYPSGFAALGWLKEWKDLRWLLPLFLVGLVGLFYPYHFDSYNCSRDRIVSFENEVGKTLYFCLDNPLSALAFQENEIHHKIESILYFQENGYAGLLPNLNTIKKNEINTYEELRSIIIDISDVQRQDTAVQRLLNERDQNFAVDYYRLAKKYYQANRIDSACLALENAALYDSFDKNIDNDIIVAQALLCGKSAPNPQSSIASIIQGRVYQGGAFSNDFSNDFNVGKPLADVQIRGAGVDTRTDAQGNFTLRLPRNYPVSSITLSFTKNGYLTINQSFTIDKVTQLPTVRLVQDATNPIEPIKTDTPTSIPPIVNTPSVLIPKDSTTTTTDNGSLNLIVPIPTMIAVKGGTFQMGSNDYDNEKPIHRVTLSDFAIGKYEVTNEQFVQFLNEKGNQTEDDVEWVNLKGSYEKEKCRIQAQGKGFAVEKEYENYPVIYVNWYGTTAYCQWLSEKTGKNYRLPTEAEWEYAARGGKQSKGFTYSGSNTVGDVAWYTDNSGSKTHPVGTKGANELGIHDMSGNVWEWCSDWFDEKYYENSAARNPKGAQSGSRRVLRGGSWSLYVSLCRSSYRFWLGPYFRDINLGFRLARD